MTSTLVIIVLLALAYIFPQTRQVLNEVTGMSPIAIGLMPMALLLMTAGWNFIEVENPQKGFAVGEAAKLEAPASILLFVAAGLIQVFAMAVRDVAENDQKQESSVNNGKMVQLLRVDAIATRLSCAAGLVGFLQIADTAVCMCMLVALVALCNILPASRQKLHDITGLSPILIGLMPLVLFLITTLYFCHEALGTALVHSMPKTEGTASPSLASKGQQASNQGMLLLIAVMALTNILPHSRQFLHDVTGASPVALGLAPLVLLLTTAASHMIEADGVQRGLAEAALDTPAGVQFLLVAALLGVFAAAVRSDEEDEPHLKDTKNGKLVNLVSADRIAWRLACAAAVIGLGHFAPSTKTAKSIVAGINRALSQSSQTGFGDSDVSLNVPEGVQLLTVAALLFVFKMAIDDANEVGKRSHEKVKEKKIQMVSISAIALRLSCAAMVAGSLKMAVGSASFAGPAPWSGAASLKDAAMCTFVNLSRHFPQSEAFGKAEVVLEVPTSIQFLVLAALVFMFKLAIDSEKAETDNSSAKHEKPEVKLVDPSRVAFRLAVGAAAFGIGQTLSTGFAYYGNVFLGSKELLAQGTMLGAATGFVMWSSRKQALNMKMC